MNALSGWEIWACAQQKIGQHGEDAVFAAAGRADALLAAGDMEGHATWLVILDRIDQMTNIRASDVRH